MVLLGLFVGVPLSRLYTFLTHQDHAPFPVLARASWGFWGSYIAIISRAILGVFWFAIQTMNGANTIRVMLGAIWPSFLTLKNDLPADAGITTNTMVAFFLFWLIQIPFLYMHPNNLRWLFMVKSVIVPVAWIAILIWAFVATDGGEIFDQKATLSGSAYSWAFLSSLTSVIGNYATLSVNQVRLSLLLTKTFTDTITGRLFSLLTRLCKVAAHLRAIPSFNLYLYILYRDCCDQRRHSPLWGSILGPHGPHRELVLSRLPLLRRLFVRPSSTGR